MSNFGQIRGNIQTNVSDVSGVFATNSEVDQYLIEAYTDIVSETRCLPKKVTLNWLPLVNYYAFQTDPNLLVTDYLATIAVFNNVSNLWLRDDLSLRDFDRIRRDWELWSGTPQFWAPHSYQRIAVTPKPSTSMSGSFVLYYWAQAPATIIEADIPLVSSDMQVLLEWYATGECLEAQSEVSKAITWWKQYYEKLEEYKLRTQKVNSSDLLLRI